MAGTQLKIPSSLQDLFSALVASFTSRRNYGYVLAQERTTSNTKQIFRTKEGITK